MCAHDRDNTVTAAFCGNEAPNITSLVDLQNLIGMGFVEGSPLPSFSLTANSSSLSTRTVSAINPRAVFVMQPDLRADESFVSLAFVRGDHMVEMAVKSPNGAFALYLLRYERECGDACTFGERLTPATESAWTRWSIYDDVDLKNSVLDCLVCHQPGGPDTPVMFRMQEFRNPWTHWMAAFGEGERVLLTDYGRAHGPDEIYAGIPTSLFVQSNPIRVENFFKDSGGVEPNEFPSETIEEEIKATNPAQPNDNSTPGVSATWEALYDRAVRGEVGPPPYHDVKITDSEKLANMTNAYRAFIAGELADLPDIRDVIRDDALSKMSIRPKRGLSGEEIVVHMCSQCHNGRLDESLSRARFDATRLSEMSREIKDAAIARLQLKREDRFKMPPTFLRELSDDEIERVVQALR